MPRRRSALSVALALLLTVAGLAATPSAGAVGDGSRIQRLDTRQLARSAAGSYASASRASIRNNFDVVGHLSFKGRTPEGDLTVYDHGGSVGKYAYVGSWAAPCRNKGVAIVKVNKPGRPRLVARARSGEGTSSEDMSVVRIGTKDVLVVGVQPCGQAARVGIVLFNVTNPKEPKRMSYLPIEPFGAHELDVVQREDGRTLALLAVNYSEMVSILDGDPTLGGDFQIADLTKPKAPKIVSEWGVIGDSALPLFHPPFTEVEDPFQGLGYAALQFAHSARGADGGMTAYVSYWDSGVLKFDISDPASPVLVGRTTFAVDDDGDAHSVVPLDVDGKRYLFQNHEDFMALAPPRITSSETADQVFSGIEEPWLPTTLTNAGEVEAPVADANDGCQEEDFVDAAGSVALIDVPFPFSEVPPPCPMGAAILRAARAGAAAVLLNYIGPDDPFSFSPGADRLKEIALAAPDLTGVMVAHDTGLIDALRSSPGNAPTRVTLTPNTPSWGYMGVYDESTAHDSDGDGVMEFERVGSFSDLPHVMGEYPAPPGTWSVHNTEVMGNRAYGAWYGNGIVSLDITDPTAPVLVGRFAKESARRAFFFGDPGAETWGVFPEPSTGLVYATDMRSGLWILRPTGPAAPTTP